MKIDKVLILNKIKLHYGFKSDAEFARFLTIKPQTLSSWYSRNTFDVDLVYAKCGDINPEFILVGKEPIEKNLVPVVKENKADYNRMPKIVTVDSHKNENITLVSVKARAGYLEGYYDAQFIKKLPTYRMPGLDNGTFRAFQVRGQSMNQSSLHDKCYAVGEWVENWVTGIKDDRIYIIVHEDWDSDREGVLIKRCLNRIDKYNNLLCKSDNLDRRSYPNINISPTSIKEVWEVKGALIFEFPNPALLFDRMNDMEADIAELQRKLLN